jgi:hypothetical protein
MVQYVGYWDNNVEYKEGPFVLCGPPIGSVGRIECEVKGHFCPCMVHPSIYKLINHHNWFKNCTKSYIVDRLNQLVIIGEIILQDRFWVAKDFL